MAHTCARFHRAGISVIETSEIYSPTLPVERFACSRTSDICDRSWVRQSAPLPIGHTAWSARTLVVFRSLLDIAEQRHLIPAPPQRLVWRFAFFGVQAPPNSMPVITARPSFLFGHRCCVAHRVTYREGFKSQHFYKSLAIGCPLRAWIIAASRVINSSRARHAIKILRSSSVVNPSFNFRIMHSYVSSSRHSSSPKRLLIKYFPSLDILKELPTNRFHSSIAHTTATWLNGSSYGSPSGPRRPHAH